MQHFQISKLTCILLLYVGSTLADECSEAKIRAFSDVFKKSEHKVRAEALYSKTCSSRSSSNGMSVTLPIEGIPLTGNASSKALRTACATQNKKFFEQYEADVLLVHASENVKLALTQACFGGVSMLAKEDSGSITVDIFARSRNDDGPVTLQSFIASPPSAVEAVSEVPSPGTELKPAGTTLVFQRKSGEDITFTANAAKGNGRATVTLPGTQELQIRWLDTPVAMKPERGFTHLMFRCKASIENGKPEVVSGTIDARPYGLTGESNGALRESYCRMKYGGSLLVAPGTNKVQSATEDWVEELANPDDFSTWMCKRDGKPLGKMQCPSDAKKSTFCKTTIGRTVACVDRYQNVNVAPLQWRPGS